jgi:DNA repair exonuclease SbcCD nuclease subunit
MSRDTFIALASGDHHYDQHTRFDECIRVHRWMAEEVARVKPDVFLSAGDLYEAASTPLERAAATDWVLAVAEHCPVVFCKGNHDAKRDLEILAKLRGRHPIIVEEAAGVHRIGRAAVAVLAWPSSASLAATLGKATTREESDAFAREMLQDVLRGLGAELAEHDGPTILLTHAMIDGSVTSLGQPLIGQAMNVGLEDLALANADIVIAGHIHKPQEWPWRHDGIEKQVLYTGSPFRTAYGEIEEKSITRVTWNEHSVWYDRIPTPATPMQLFEARWESNVIGGPPNLSFPADHYPDAARVRGADCRLKYRFPSDARDAAVRAAESVREQMLANGALHVKLDDEVIANTRARAPEVATAETTREKLEVLWRVRGTTPDDDRKGRLFTKLDRLEAA